MGLIKGVFKIGVVAAAAYGVYSLFKDEIRETETYQQLNQKYDVDNKIDKATEAVKSTLKETANSVSEKAKTAKGMATEKVSEFKNRKGDEAVNDFDNNFDDDFGDDFAEISDSDFMEAAEDAAEDVAEDVAGDAAEAVEEKTEEKVEETAEAAEEKIEEKVEEAVETASEKAAEAVADEEAYKDVSDAVDNITID
jgi:hypothetical protein